MNLKEQAYGKLRQNKQLSTGVIAALLNADIAEVEKCLVELENDGRVQRKKMGWIRE